MTYPNRQGLEKRIGKNNNSFADDIELEYKWKFNSAKHYSCLKTITSQSSWQLELSDSEVTSQSSWQLELSDSEASHID